MTVATEVLVAVVGGVFLLAGGALTSFGSWLNQRGARKAEAERWERETGERQREARRSERLDAYTELLTAVEEFIGVKAAQLAGIVDFARYQSVLGRVGAAEYRASLLYRSDDTAAGISSIAQCVRVHDRLVRA